MGLFDRDDLLPGLMPAMYRGVAFHVPDTSHEVGRRLAVTLFPGVDAAAFDDLGRHDGPVYVAGLLLGDDYVGQALALQAALQAPGPGTLLHPWLGEMTVVVADPALIRFSARALRLVQFDASFLRADIEGGLLGSTLAGLLASVVSLVSIPAQILGAVIGTATLAASTWSAVVGSAGAAGAILSGAVSTSPAAAQLVAATDPHFAALGRASTSIPGASSAVALAAAIGGASEAIATSAIGAPVPAIGSGSASAAIPSRLDPRAGAEQLLAAAEAVDALQPVGVADGAMRLAAEVAIVAAAIRAAAEIEFESRQDAMAWRARIVATLARLSRRAAELAPSAPAAAALALDAFASVSAALGRDMNEVIGRLPSVTRIAPAAPVSAWLIAQHLAGDDPADVVAMLDDIVMRNRLAHPALVTPDGVEVLV